jgi:hypothetical protein
MKTISNITKLILLSGIMVLVGSTESTKAWPSRHERCDRDGNCYRHAGLVGNTVGFAGDVVADTADTTAYVATGGRRGYRRGYRCDENGENCRRYRRYGCDENGENCRRSRRSRFFGRSRDYDSYD